MLKLKSAVSTGLSAKIILMSFLMLSASSSVHAAFDAVNDGDFLSDHDGEDNGTFVAVVLSPIWVPLALAAVVIAGPPYGLYKAGKGLYKFVKRKKEERRQKKEERRRKKEQKAFDEYLCAAEELVSYLNNEKDRLSENNRELKLEKIDYSEMSYRTRPNYELEKDGSILITLNRIRTKLLLTVKGDSLRFNFNNVAAAPQISIQSDFLRDLYNQGIMDSLEGLAKISEEISRLVISVLVHQTCTQSEPVNTDDDAVSQMTESSLCSVVAQT